MININNVVLVGRLTKDVELRKTQTNKSTCNFTLAVDRRFSQNKEADFINCIAWNQSADFLSQYAGKGAIVSVEGRMQTRNYDGTNGKVYVTEVVADSVQIISQKRESKETNEFNYQQSLGGTLSNRDDKIYEQKYGKTNIKTDEIPPEKLPFY